VGFHFVEDKMLKGYWQKKCGNNNPGESMKEKVVAVTQHSTN
jgi:hypothetical protein